MGAMENKSLNVFNTSAVLATPEVSTDDQLERVAGIVAHEYFHVSCTSQDIFSGPVCLIVADLLGRRCRTILATG